MKISNGSLGRRWRRTGADRRAQLLAAFERSGMSAAAFAQQHGLNYTTFCGWRQRRTAAKLSRGFVQVELPTWATHHALGRRQPEPTRFRCGSHRLFHLVITANKFASTNLTAKVSFSRLVLEGGKLADANRGVSIGVATK